MKDFQEGLLALVLDYSESRYGPYQLDFLDREMSTGRSMLATERGEIHTGFSTGWGLHASEGRVDLYSYPYLKGLLGLRKVIIRREDEKRFASIRTLAQLAEYSAGQGAGWPDTRVYESYGVRVVSAENYLSLFPMLAKGRFDFLPMSVLEIDGALEAVASQYPDLMIASNLYIFYPIPLYISVSRTRPDISNRIAFGLERLFEGDDNQGLEALLRRQFPSYSQQPVGPAATLLQMDNPFIEPARNLAIRNYFTEHYLSVRTADGSGEE